VATLAHLFGSRHDQSVIRTGRYVSFVCLLASPVFLIWDLGRPERFLHMLRVVKLRSTMSLGTWGLTTFGLFCGLSAAHQMAHDGILNWFPFLARIMKALPIKIIEIVGSFFGMFVASYTGVLLATTAAPLWSRARYIIGPLFLTSGLSSALACLSFILSPGRQNQNVLDRLERAELIGLMTELGLISSLPSQLGPLARPLFRGRIGLLFSIGTLGAGIELPLLLRLVWKLTRKPMPRLLNASISLMVLVGGLILRYVWIAAGRVSADDPHATHYYNALERHKADYEFD
jgi:formate-dependent nitrite reductase membrane component NrfD